MDMDKFVYVIRYIGHTEYYGSIISVIAKDDEEVRFLLLHGGFDHWLNVERFSEELSVMDKFRLAVPLDSRIVFSFTEAPDTIPNHTITHKE